MLTKKMIAIAVHAFAFGQCRHIEQHRVPVHAKQTAHAALPWHCGPHHNPHTDAHTAAAAAAAAAATCRNARASFGGADPPDSIPIFDLFDRATPLPPRRICVIVASHVFARPRSTGSLFHTRRSMLRGVFTTVHLLFPCIISRE